jgi:hypothetical protein
MQTSGAYPSKKLAILSLVNVEELWMHSSGCVLRTVPNVLFNLEVAVLVNASSAEPQGLVGS